MSLIEKILVFSLILVLVVTIKVVTLNPGLHLEAEQSPKAEPFNVVDLQLESGEPCTIAVLGDDLKTEYRTLRWCE